jgi:nucleotide-binding universal stress UspA family protein
VTGASKRVYLAGYDGSAESHAAVRVAARLADATDAELIAVNVYSGAVPAYWTGIEGVDLGRFAAELRAQAEEAVEALDLPGVGRKVVEADSPAHGLQDLAEAAGASLIAVGTTHRGALGRLAPGSVGMHLLHGAPCPVLVVPAESDDDAPRTVGVAYDDRDESRAALHFADELAQRLGARLVVLGARPVAMVPVGIAPVYPAEIVNEAERRFQEMLERVAAGTVVDAEARTLIGPAAKVLAEASQDVDLLVTGSRGYGAIAGVVLGSVSRHLVDHADCPVLVVPRPRA